MDGLCGATSRDSCKWYKQLIDKAKSASKDPNQITFDRIKSQKWCVKGDW